MDRCDTCGRELSYGATISVTGRGTYCSPCYNAWAAEKWGVRFDNAELEPVTQPVCRTRSRSTPASPPGPAT